VPLGKLGRKIITNGFRSTRLLRQERSRKSAVKQLGREWLGQARPTVPLGELGCKIKTNGFLIILNNRVFSSEKVAFFRKNFQYHYAT
jgi:hypothetical protein